MHLLKGADNIRSEDTFRYPNWTKLNPGKDTFYDFTN